jgi:hypothetical protein
VENFQFKTLGETMKKKKENQGLNRWQRMSRSIETNVSVVVTRPYNRAFKI